MQTVENVNYALWCGTNRQMTNQIGWQESEWQRVRHLAKDGGENAAGSKYIPQCHYDFYYWETEDEEPQTERKT